MPERDELDRLIDSELARYGEPRAGLEQRILARVSANAERAPRRRWLLLAVGTPLAAVLLIFGYVLQRTPNGQHMQTAIAPATTSGSRPESNPVRRLSPDSVSRIYKHSAKHLQDRTRLSFTDRPKLDTFPTLLQPTDSERAIIRFAAEASEPERNALVAPNQELTEPIRITALHIPPLPPPGEDTN